MAETLSYKRPVTATLHRKAGSSTKIVWVRRYASVKNALNKAIELALLTGQPGDTVELTHSNYEFHIASVVLHVNAKSIMDLRIQFFVEREII